MGFETVAPIWDLDLTGDELSESLRSYVDDIPPSVVRVIAALPELTVPSGTSEPRGVIAGMVFAMVRRASYYARLKWFLFRVFDSWQASCMLRGLGPRDQGVKSDQKARPGFDGGRFDEQYGGRFDEQYGDQKARPW